jgi:hypothetical protein
MHIILKNESFYVDLMSKNLDMDKTKTIKINGLMISLGGRSELLLPAYDPQGIMARSILSMV